MITTGVRVDYSVWFHQENMYLFVAFMLCRYAALAPLYYRGAAVAVVVYDITSVDSFTKAQYWVKVIFFFLK